MLNRKIKIMHIKEAVQMGGTERMLCHLAPNFSKDKFESMILCPGHESDVTAEWRKYGVEEIVCLNHSSYYNPMLLFKLISALKKYKPDVVFCYGLRINLYARLAAHISKVPVFITGQRGIEDWKGKIAVFLEKITSRYVDEYIGNSQACCEILANREGISRDKLKVIYNGINLEIPDDYKDRATSIRKNTYPPNSFVIGAIGRLNPVKGHEFLVNAVPDVINKYPNAYFVMLGNDQYDGYIHRLVKDKGLQSHIALPGYSSDVASWIESFDILVMPSLSEGMPVTVLEAFLMKCPVIATDVGGTSELLHDGENGLLIPSRDSAAIAEAIIEMYENPDQCQAMIEKAYRLADTTFTNEKMISEYEHAVIELLERKGVR